MPVPTDITAGTISISGSTVTGVGTSFVASDIRQGDLFIWIEGGAGQWSPIVQTVTSNTVLTLAEPWTGPTISGARYRLRYQWDSSRVSAQSRQLIELLDNGNILALASLTGPGVPVFDGPHSMTVRPTQDFINGVTYDVQVDTLPDRAAYDGQALGFSVLVSDVGDGRSALYSKASNTSGDWTDPAYITGPIGGTPEIAAGTTTTLPPGSDATFTVAPDGSGGYLLSAGIPEGEGFYWAGAYNSSNSYLADRVVSFNGSTFIALQAVTAGTAPSGATPPVDSAFWAVLAARGANGSGTGDVVGPASSVNNRIAVFSGTTGKLIADSGATIASLVPADNSITNAKLADVASATIKGRVAAGTGDPQDLTASQVWTLLGVAPVANIPDTLTADKAFRRGNVLGTVSETSGVPTGALLERGSNSNGEYIRFADGTLICWTVSGVSQTTTGAVGALFETPAAVNWTFPSTFANTPPAMVGSPDSSSRWMTFGLPGLSGVAYRQLSYSNQSAGVGSRLMAIGRWF